MREKINNKLKIMLITLEFSEFFSGGAGVYAFELTRALSKKNIDIHVIIPSSKTKTQKINDNLIIHYKKIWNGLFLNLISFIFSINKICKQIIKKNKIEIVHNNTIYPSLINFKKIKKVNTIHHLLSYEPKNKGLISKIRGILDKKIEKLFLNKSDKLIAVSLLTKKAILNINPNFNKKLFFIPEGIDTNLFKKTNNIIRKKYKIKDKETLLFFPGGARSKRKGAEIAFNALNLLKKEGINFKCLISGKSREIGWKKDFNALIKENDLSNELILLGELSYKNLPEYYSASDIVIFPSLFEGFGIPILESMACSKPIITSKTGEAQNIIKNGTNGFLIDIGDNIELSNKLKFLIENPKLRKKIGENGRTLIEQKYSWDKIVNQYIQLYKQTINQK